MLIIVLEGRNPATRQNANDPEQFHWSSRDYIPISSLKDANKATGTGGTLQWFLHIDYTGLSGLPQHLNNKQNT